MVKTTVYIPDEMKMSLESLARRKGCSEAEVIREALQTAIDRGVHPRPRIPLGDDLGDPTTAERVDELLMGFGGD